jgi:hypothetical protein
MSVRAYERAALTTEKASDDLVLIDDKMNFDYMT